MPAVISLKTATVSQLYQAGGPPVSTTIYGQTLIDFVKDSKFGGLLFANSIPVAALQSINASKITTQSLSGAIGGTTRPGQLAWNTINTNNIVPQGIETAAIKDRAVNRNKIATESIFLEHFSDTSLSEFANKISTGEIAQKINRAGDRMTGTLNVAGSIGSIASTTNTISGVTFNVSASGTGLASNAAFIGFNRGADVARFGLDTDNIFKVGGGVLGLNSYEIVHSNNIGTIATTNTTINNFYVRANGATTMTGNLNVRQNTGTGSVSLVTGDTTRPGYIAFIQPNGQRAGYIGWQNSNTTQLLLDAENGYSFRFVQTPFIGNNPISTESYVQAATANVLTQFPSNFVTTDGTTQNITGPKTFRATTPIRVERANTNDAIILDGRNGGNSSHAITITTASLGGSRTYTLPEVAGNADFVLTAGAQTIGGVKTFSSTALFTPTNNQAISLNVVPGGATTAIGLGVQDASLYFRTGNNFRWYRTGSHNTEEGKTGAANNTGNLMLLDVNGDLRIRGKLYTDHASGNNLDSNSGGGTNSFRKVKVTTNYSTGSVFEKMYVDTTTSSLTITLKENPDDFDEYIIIDIARNWHVNNCIINRGAKTINGGTSNLICNQRGVKIHLIFYNNDWKVII